MKVKTLISKLNKYLQNMPVIFYLQGDRLPEFTHDFDLSDTGHCLQFTIEGDIEPKKSSYKKIGDYNSEE